jgi:hypothetical protein
MFTAHIAEVLWLKIITSRLGKYGGECLPHILQRKTGGLWLKIITSRLDI